jgi:hypothetical protein
MLAHLALLLAAATAADFSDTVPKEEQDATHALEVQLLQSDYQIDNALPPLFNRDDPRSFHRRPEGQLPISVPPFDEHRREWVTQSWLQNALAAVHMSGSMAFVVSQELSYTFYGQEDENTWTGIRTPQLQEGIILSPRVVSRLLQPHLGGGTVPLPVLPVESCVINDFVKDAGGYWFATSAGLFRNTEKHRAYGVQGPLSTTVTALARDSQGTLWIGTPVGLSILEANGGWRQLRGKDGLPYEDITALAFDTADRLWIGTSKGAIQYRPYEEGRQWFYRQGPRYLPHDHINDVAISADNNTVCFATEGGLGVLHVAQTTLLEKAETIERLVNERHRRQGLVAAATLDNAANPTAHTIEDNDNDGLWTAYHVAAMSMAYTVTG